jgi:hypothetical protein
MRVAVARKIVLSDNDCQPPKKRTVQRKNNFAPSFTKAVFYQMGSTNADVGHSQARE